MSRILAAFLIYGLTLGSAHALDSITTRLVGVWAAEGTIRPKGYDAAEKIKCRFVGRELNALQVNLEGKCATTSGTAKFRLLIAHDESGRFFAAKARFANKADYLAMVGSAKGNILTLDAKDQVLLGTRISDSSLSLVAPEKGNVTMTNTLTDAATGDQSQSLVLTLRRKK